MRGLWQRFCPNLVIWGPLSLFWTAILVCDLLWWRVSLPGFVFVAWFVELPEEFGWLVPAGVHMLGSALTGSVDLRSGPGPPDLTAALPLGLQLRR
eukprot:gene9293-11930_t